VARPVGNKSPKALPSRAGRCTPLAFFMGVQNPPLVEHLRYRGTVQRALFTAQDPKSLRQAFDKLKPTASSAPSTRSPSRASRQSRSSTYL